MANNIKGINSLAYQGVNAVNPPNMRKLKRAPTATDSKNVNIGDFWLNTTSQRLYQLTSLSDDIAVWNEILGSSSTESISISTTSTADSAITLDAEDGGVLIETTRAQGITFSNGDETVQILVGTGDPNTNPTTGLQGSLYIRTDTGVAATTLYVNTNGAHAWTALT